MIGVAIRNVLERYPDGAGSTQASLGRLAAANERPAARHARLDAIVPVVLIIGVNLEGALQCVSPLADLATSGGTVRLVAMDPDGSALALSAAMSGVGPTLRRQKIIQNLELLRAELGTRLDAEARDRVSLMVTDLVFPVGVVGLDEHTRSGSLIIRHYLTGTASEHAPLMWLHAERDEPWFGRYLAQCEACVGRAREWAGVSV